MKPRSWVGRFHGGGSVEIDALMLCDDPAPFRRSLRTDVKAAGLCAHTGMTPKGLQAWDDDRLGSHTQARAGIELASRTDE